MKSKLVGIRNYMMTLGLPIIGPQIFIESMPPDAVPGMMLMDTYSGSQRHDYYPGWRDTGFSVVIRHAKYVDGYEAAWVFAEAMRVGKPTKVGGLNIRLLRATNDPKSYRFSEGGIWEFEVDFDLIFTFDD